LEYLLYIFALYRHYTNIYTGKVVGIINIVSQLNALSTFKNTQSTADDTIYTTTQYNLVNKSPIQIIIKICMLFLLRKYLALIN